MNKIKVLIVDDSITIQQLLAYVISKDTGLEVIGMACNGRDALHQIKRQRPDVILMDVVMPLMDGIETTRHIMQIDPIPIIIVTAYYNNKEMDVSIEALRAGAVSVIQKPKGIGDPSFNCFKEELFSLIKTVSNVKLIPRYSSNKTVVQRVIEKKKYSIVVVGASLGGPQALISILSDLPADYGLPLLVVQHIADGFVNRLVDWLNRNTQLKVVIAKDGEVPRSGYVYFAPDHSHLELNKNFTIKLSEDKEDHEAVPSVNRLFRSAAQTYGDRAIGILLTGMGRDGADGLLLMKQKGALTIVQDEESCMVFGMPKEAIQLGAAEKVLSLNDIAPTLKNLIQGK